MVTRTKDQNTLVLGDWNAICDVCGFKFKASDLKRRWDGMMVCMDDYESRHPSDFFSPDLTEGHIPWSRPETTDGGGTDIEGGEFPPDENTDTTDIGYSPDDDGYGTFGSNNRTL